MSQGVNKRQMIGAVKGVLRHCQTRLQRLFRVTAEMENGIECKFVRIDEHHRASGSLSASPIGLAERTAEGTAA